MPRGGIATETRLNHEFHWSGPETSPQDQGSHVDAGGADKCLPPDHRGQSNIHSVAGTSINNPS